MDDSFVKEQGQLQQTIDFLTKIFLSFFIYSVVGYIYETVLEVLWYRTGFTNRGFMFGPYLPIYGTGAIIILAVFSKWRRKVSPMRIVGSFIGIFFMTTLVELIGSYIMEAVTGGFIWDYSQFAFNFQGRIAPNPSMRFAIGGTFLLYGVHPPFERSVDKYPRVYRIMALVVGFIMLGDLIVSLMK